MLSVLQGATLLTHSFGDPSYVVTEANRLRDWVAAHLMTGRPEHGSEDDREGTSDGDGPHSIRRDSRHFARMGSTHPGTREPRARGALARERR